MIRKSLLLKFFDAANMQRWNDKIRPVELRELDKQAHKMIIAYILGKTEEEADNRKIDWIKIIEGGVFEFLQRTTITDLKPQLFDKIKQDKKSYGELNEWAYNEIKPAISSLGDVFCDKYKNYLLERNETVERKVLNAAHLYATKWEFEIIERANPDGYEIKEIKETLQNKLEKYNDLRGIRNIAQYSDYKKFIDLCGQLRFQIRWGHLNIVPRVSVLGHMLIVAMLSYLFSSQIGACEKRCINNYFTGLFHDLPEVLTRDVISPVKRSAGKIDAIIKKYEQEEMEEKVYKLIPGKWHAEMRMFTENEFAGVVTIKGDAANKSSAEIQRGFNKDKYNPRDGELVKAVDVLAAFIEAYLGAQNGLNRHKFEAAKYRFREEYKEKTIAGINFGEIYADFFD